MFFTRCDICGRELSEKENRWNGRFEVPPKKGEKSDAFSTIYSLDVCENDLEPFLEKFHAFLESVKYARK